MPPTRIVIEQLDFFLRNVRARLPFRYGKATLTRMPLLHVRMRVRGEGGSTAEGYSADCLPPKWFDKNPARTYRNNIDDLVASVRIAEEAYREASKSPQSVFEIWWDAFGTCRERASSAGFNGLTASFGSSLMERALMDAACKIAGLPLHEWIPAGGLGMEPGRVHPELLGAPFIPKATGASAGIMVRQTVGLADPIRTSEIIPSERVDDGIPQSLEEWVKRSGVKYFKVKAGGDVEADRGRLSRIAEMLDSELRGDYRLSLDGNEVFSSLESFRDWWSDLASTPALAGLIDRTLYIEQPFERSIALDSEVCGGLNELESLPPVIIDESDGDLDSFRRAVELGYRGCSIKNCKGPIKSILNGMLTDRWAVDGVNCFLTGEDLANLPVVPLQQDLALMDLLGVHHAERNGHHYFRGLEHLTESERRACLSDHETLYEDREGLAQLRIVQGRLDLSSLRSNGFGACPPPDFSSMTPLSDWKYESLGFDE